MLLQSPARPRQPLQWPGSTCGTHERARLRLRVRLLRGARDTGAPGRADRTLRRPLGGRGPRLPRGPVRPRTGFTPLLRLLGLIAFAILLVLLLLWVQSCQEDQKGRLFRLHDGHLRGRPRLGAGGRELSDVLTTPGIKPAELQKQLRPRPAAGDRDDAGAQPRPTGAAARLARGGARSLAFRVSGLAGLAEAFKRTQGSKDAAAGASCSRSRRSGSWPATSSGTTFSACRDGAARRGDRGRRGARLELRADAGPREHALDDGPDLGTDQRLRGVEPARPRACTARASSRSRRRPAASSSPSRPRTPSRPPPTSASPSPSPTPATTRRSRSSSR